MSNYKNIKLYVGFKGVAIKEIDIGSCYIDFMTFDDTTCVV